MSPRTPNPRPGRPVDGRTLVIRDALVGLTELYDRMTVRQVFYQLEVRGIVEKTEKGYRHVQKQVLQMRREGLLPWEFIVDGTRWQRKPSTFGDASEFVTAMTRGYRRDLWRGNPTGSRSGWRRTASRRSSPTSRAGGTSR